MATSSFYSQQAVGVGLVLGAGIGATTATIVGFDLASGTGYGVAGGIVLGALLGRLLDRRAAAGDPVLAWLFGPALGLVVGGAVGMVGAWSADAALVDGLLVGAGAGVALGVLLGGVLSATGRADDAEAAATGERDGVSEGEQSA